MAQGIAGLESHKRRPKHSPSTKTGAGEVALILELRSQRNLGARRIQSELKQLHSISLAMVTIHKVLCKNQVKPVVKFRCKADFIRYRVLRLYSRHTPTNTLDFIECVIEEMPFPIHRFQTDRGRKFFAVKVQEKLKEYGIKFRPNKPASLHLNGKVERTQKTDKAEFYATVDLCAYDLKEQLVEWQHYYNWERPHSAHNGKILMERYFELADKTPYSDAVHTNYQPNEEHIQDQNYKIELELRKLKRYL